MNDSQSREARRRAMREKVTTWLAEPMPTDVRKRIAKIAADRDVVHVAVMPDVHLTAEYCVGTALATHSLIFPQAVGSDIGCGMLAARLECSSELIANRGAAILALLHELIPIIRHRADSAIQRLPASIANRSLSDPRLDKIASRDGRVQLGSLGRGNHFVEFQSDEDGAAWMMLHSGSRGMGQAITTHHLALANTDDVLPSLSVDSDLGQNYLHDQEWAREYASQNRMRMLQLVAELLESAFGVALDENSLIHSDHNHVQFEEHGGDRVWVHRKGAQSAKKNEPGVIPGSMGETSYHVIGRGHPAALRTSSHGAGRRLSRTEARRSISTKSLQRQMKSVIFDSARAESLCEEAPDAYKDIRRVMRAQRDMVRIERRLTPLLSFKG